MSLTNATRNNEKKIFRKNYQESFKITLDTGEGKTVQSSKDECDVNTIIKRAIKAGGLLPDMISQNARYGDFSQVTDYQNSLNVVKHAQDQFNALSSTVRKRFDNDPAKFLDFATNPSNLSEMVTLGLAIKTQSEIVKSDSQEKQSDPATK